MIMRTLVCGMNMLKKIIAKEAVVGVIGLGYVGLPLVLRHASVECNVIGFDIDASKIDDLKAHKSYIAHFSDEAVGAAMTSYADATTDFRRIRECDALIICVPTPLTKYREPDLSYVVSTLETIQPYLRKGQIISLESTTWPGTTEEVVVPFVEASGLRVGKDVNVVFSPEREDPGNSLFSTHTIPKIVGGITESCLEAGVALYKISIENDAAFRRRPAVEPHDRI